MKKLFLTFVFASVLMFASLANSATCTSCHPGKTTVKINEVALQKAKSYLHVREQNNNNRGPEIDKWHKYHGLPFGNPYCQMFVNYCYYEAFLEYGMKTPLPKYAHVGTMAKWAHNHPLEVRVISTKAMIWGVDEVQPGDMLSWKHGAAAAKEDFTYPGHAGMNEYPYEKKIRVHGVEGNTKPTDKGDQTGKSKDTQWGKDGVYERDRNIGIGTNFPILYIIRLQQTEFEVTK